MTPHYMEDINYSMKELKSSTDEVSILFYMQQIYPGQGAVFLDLQLFPLFRIFNANLSVVTKDSCLF